MLVPLLPAAGIVSVLCVFLFWRMLKEKHYKTLFHSTKQENEKLENEIENFRKDNVHLEKQVTKLTTQSENQQSMQKQFEERFKNLSQEILDSKSKKFEAEAQKNISNLLLPLKEKIESFQTKVESTYVEHSKEQHSLKEQIRNLCEVHSELKNETRHLSKTLKGDVKAQGQWGEMILSTILEASGLKENEHYSTQGKEFQMKDEQGHLQKPDVIIKLPDEKQIVIDSKVSLTHYEKFISSDSDEQKKMYLEQFIKSIRTHSTQLSEKKYQFSEHLNTPEFVLMFFPIEGAFSLALQKDRSIFEFCWNQSIIIVSPTTLLATLKTVESIWKREKLNRNTIEIALASGMLYDKFTSFTRDLDNIGDHLKKAENSYSSAVNKLSTGKGNIVSKLEKIKKMGARTSKEMPKKFLSGH